MQYNRVAYKSDLFISLYILTAFMSADAIIGLSSAIKNLFL